MRKYIDKLEDIEVNPQITEPSQAFTPRQILDQFARGELSVKTFSPTDGLSEDYYTEDQLLDGDVVSFEDEFEAQDYINDLRLEEVKHETDKDSKPVEQGDDGASANSGQ